MSAVSIVLTVSFANGFAVNSGIGSI
jgi:hypothetical protein